MRYLFAIALAGCTTLGPMPTTTGMSAVPAQRPGAEAQLGIVPAYFLSSSVQKPHGAATTQLELVLEPDRWFNAPGLVIGGRLFGQADDTPGEPLLGYRAKLSEDLSIAGVVYGTSKRSTQKLASYHATRIGGELAVDANTIAIASWLAMHVQAAFSATRVSASGTYCVDANGVGKDCDQMNQANNTMIDGHLSGVYPSGTGSITLDVGRRESGILHGARLALMGSTGWMPTATNGIQGDSQAFFSLGLSLTLGLGKSE
jgi:hypothetical protein